MAHIVPYLLGGATALLASDIMPLPSFSERLSLRSPAAAEASLLGTPDRSVNRDNKAGRGATTNAPQSSARIASVEVVGLNDAAIVYRDREGRVLFRTDPLNNVTIVTKGLQLPEVTVRHSTSSVVRPVPVEDVRNEPPREPKRPNNPARKLPRGCESAFSPVAAPSLAHHVGRCTAGIQGALHHHG
jgi:hypothetical protein